MISANQFKLVQFSSEIVRLPVTEYSSVIIAFRANPYKSHYNEPTHNYFAAYKCDYFVNGYSLN